MAGGLLDIAYVTHVTSSISFVIRLDILSSISWGMRAQSAVIASTELTMRIVTILPYLRSSPTTPTRCRHPFPGPGLAVRIIGEITKEKLAICRTASAIVEDELRSASLYDDVWQAYASVGDDRAVGVVGDERRYGRIVTIRIVSSVDAMTADWARIPHEILDKMSRRITNEIEEVTWVTYAISSKPPATIEPL